MVIVGTPYNLFIICEIRGLPRSGVGYYRAFSNLGTLIICQRCVRWGTPEEGCYFNGNVPKRKI